MPRCCCYLTLILRELMSATGSECDQESISCRKSLAFLKLHFGTVLVTE